MEIFMSPFIVPVGIMFAIAFMVVGSHFAKALGRKWDREGQQALSPEVSGRLERMEQALDAIAVEVERVSEGQRFTTKLLTERSPADALGAEQRGGMNAK